MPKRQKVPASLQIPSPPFLTDKEARIHWSLLRSTLRMVNKAALGVLSNSSSSGFKVKLQFDYRNFGITRLFFSSTNAS